MTELLEMKQRLKIFYGKYDVYLKPALKFLLALFAFFMINEQIGFMQKLSGPAVSLLLALLCSFLPVNMIAVFAGLLVMYILYFRVSPKYGYVLVLTPIAFLLKIPYAIPLTMGLLGGPACVVPVACGTVFYYLIYYMKNNEAMLASSETEQMTSRLSYLVENVLNNKTVILTVLVFAVVLMIVYAIHRLSADHAWHIAIGAGAVTNIVLFLVGALVMQVKVPIIQLILGTLVSIVIAMAVEFFVFSVDYSRTEYAQFEDDEYYYYVKAVPKMSIAVSDKQVKRINTRHRTGQRKRH